jgi:hypothetical protein
MNPAVKHISLPIEYIRVHPNEYVTVWLVLEDEPASGLQVELRVRPDGVPEIFADDIEIKSFNDWYFTRENAAPNIPF